MKSTESLYQTPTHGKLALFAVILIGTIFSGHVFGAVDLVEPASAVQAFRLASAGTAAPIVLPANAPEVVKITARASS
jgi:hypothetical protein